MATTWEKPNLAVVAPNKEVEVIDTVEIDIEDINDLVPKMTIKSTELLEKDAYEDATHLVLQHVTQFDDGSIHAIVDLVNVKDW